MNNVSRNLKQHFAENLIKMEHVSSWEDTTNLSVMWHKVLYVIDVPRKGGGERCYFPPPPPNMVTIYTGACRIPYYRGATRAEW